jgi:ABC-type bacteriocin/lantibiotic exporter with double-glycine peptidase domain
MNTSINSKNAVVTYSPTVANKLTTVDFSSHVDEVKTAIALNHSSVRPNLIVIQGKSGSGKSGLAKALQDEVSRSVLIDAGHQSNYKCASLEVEVLDDEFYIIDELAFCSEDTIRSLFNSGNGIVLTMSLKDIPQDLLTKRAIWMTLDREKGCQLASISI